MCFNDLEFKTSDRGFMGPTHALSGLAVLLALVAFVPAFSEWAGFTSLAIVALAALVVAGASLLPDLDNSASSAKSAFGLFGDALSFLFIHSSIFMQTVFSTRKDDKTPNPHRGFWHTIPAALLLGLGTLGLTLIPGKISIPVYGEVSISWLVALIICVLSTHLAFAGLFGKFVKKIKKDAGVVGEFAALGVALVSAAVIFWFIPHEGSFWWLAVAVTVGVIVHILGDFMTTAGVPILFPLSYFIHGKFWWNSRLLPIKAGGIVETAVFIPLFALISVGSLVKIIWDLFN